MASRYYFNYKDLNDEDLQGLYEQAFRVGKKAVHLFRKNYKRNGNKLYVQFRYIRDDQHFNARAELTPKGYEIGISVPTIYLIRTLFDSLLLDRKVLPTIRRGIGKHARKHFSVQFLKDVEEIERYKRIRTTADLDRLLVSSLLTDFCSTFIVLHEVGHVVFGHADFMKHNFQGKGISEFYGGSSSGKFVSVSQVHEYDADLVAAKLLSQYIYFFVQDIPSHPVYSKLLGGLQPEEHLLESITALALEGLLCMFIYLAHAASEIQKQHTHPYPMVRIRYIRDLVGRQMRDNYGLDIELTNKYIRSYASQLIFSLIGTKLMPFPKHEMVSSKNVGRRMNSLIKRADKLRALTEPYTWVPLSEWIKN